MKVNVVFLSFGRFLRNIRLATLDLDIIKGEDLLSSPVQGVHPSPCISVGFPQSGHYRDLKPSWGLSF